MKKELKTFILTFASIFTFVQSCGAITMKPFDFIVGVNGDFKAALSDAGKKASSSNRYYIFFPKGEYNIGTLTGSGNQMTTITTSNISIIGESNSNTTLYNKPTQERIDSTATLYFNNANNIYMQDITILNKGDYGSASAGTATGRFVAIEDRSDKNIYKNVKLLSNQDTYYSLSKRTYWEDSEIHGYVDFICGYGDIFFNRCLLYLEKRSTVVIAAPSTSTSWGYVFSDCTIDGYADGYRLGRAWNNAPKCVFINTIMKKVPLAAGWGDPMNVVPNVFAEYNSKTASGVAVDLKDRRTTYTIGGTTVNLNPVLTAAQAATYTITNVLKGSDNWQPDSYTKQQAAPIVSKSGSTLKWDDNTDALCWVVFKDGKYFKCVTTPSVETASGTGMYIVKAANAMGGLGAASNAVSADGTPVMSNNSVNTGTFSIRHTSVNNVLSLSIPSRDIGATLRIISGNGRIVFVKQLDSMKSEIDLRQIAAGSYIFEISLNNSTDAAYSQTVTIR